jgi:hypothetical protein
MKTSLQNLFLAASLFTACVSLAQPTLTAASINPVVGDAIVDYNTNYLSPGTAGANQTWNLSTFTISTTNSYTAVNPSSTTYSASFTNANVCETNGAGYYGYYKTSATALQIYGNVVSSGTTTTVMPYSNPEDFLHFPFTYTNSYTDTWATTFVSAGTTYYRKGADSVTADGYGTLTLPNGTYSNVLRVHFVQNYRDSASLGGSPFIITYRNDEYVWYLNGNHYPIATVSSLATSFGGSPTVSQYGSYMKNIVAGIENMDVVTTSCNLFPNPASTTITLNLNLTGNKKVEVRLFNSIGEQINVTINADGIQGSNNYNLDVTHVSEGIYFAQISLDGVLTSTKRFVVTK